MTNKERIRKELRELIKRSDELLDNEINVSGFQKLSPTKQQLLKEQFGVMTQYRQVLVLRLHYGVE